MTGSRVAFAQATRTTLAPVLERTTTTELVKDREKGIAPGGSSYHR